jgi:hypothetical protein
LVFCYEAPTPRSIVEFILNYEKKDSMKSKVDMKVPFAMLLRTLYMAQIKFFPNFY